ncbi:MULTISPECIES: GTPase family protein [Bacillaceae]|uniref:50S ribosome-binding GTPase n=1 Tax=Evansella alkalicola TaxID=745819 RepID=A0ABS6JMW1_9BACI|nr:MULTISPECIES: GTPase [Bacillaceae]MBU9719897.1 50S ribosome-binding GTPase [Bacillus alkalicola]
MAIDKEKAKDLLESIDEIFDLFAKGLNEETKNFLKKAVMGPAIEEIRKLVEDARPPVLLVMGRSGHGKSSIINALAGKHVATVNDVKPETPETIPYLVTFEESFSTWQIIDTRGIFETTKPTDSSKEDAVSVLKNSILKYSPDVIMHVVSTPSTRNLSNDFDVYNEIMAEVKKEHSVSIPTILVLNKADTIGNPREWPPEENAKKAGLLLDVINYMTKDVLNVERTPLNNNFHYRGFTFNDSNYVGIIPVCSLEDDLWNIESLSDLIGNNLSEEAKFDFFQALKRKEQLRKVSSSLIKRFTGIASGIGSTPIPIADIAILTPLQLLLITIIGGLSGREISKETAHEYLAAAGVNVGAAIGIREGARQLSKLIPVGGLVISGSIAGAATYSIGKSAEAYFFYNKKVKVKDIKKEIKKEMKDKDLDTEKNEVGKEDKEVKWKLFKFNKKDNKEAKKNKDDNKL